MAIELADYGQLIEVVSDMRFRNEAHIKIAKAKREIAYTQTVDLIVESINFSQYENYKSSPPLQFYGYAELVFQDALSLEIPIRFPRQRIYQAYQWEALRQWSEYIPFLASRQYHRNTILQIEAIKAALQIPATVEVEAELWETKWIELPLREIHIRLQSDCQFSISYAQYQPVPFNDPLSPVPKVRDGKSKQVDGEKDSGLPTQGIRPKRNEAGNLWSGNYPVSSALELSNSGFSPLSKDNLTNTDPNNIDPNFIPQFWVRAQTAARFAYLGCDKIRNEDYSYYLSAYDETVRLVEKFTSQTGCNGTVGTDYGLVSNLTNLEVGASGVTDNGNVTLSYGTGEKPENRLYVT